ncbi:MAG: hypothetical protein LQ343_000560 [Gyalolechia ehrenbergii]|nr:MAG: hypothetical protein LQ343_000560 [Gyalolechia ehrenbergii]
MCSMEPLVDLSIADQDGASSSPPGNPNSPGTMGAAESSSQSQDEPQRSRRTSRFLRDSAMGAYVYEQGRRNGANETEADLSRQFEDLDRKFLADLDRERDEQKYTVDKIRAHHQAEIAARNDLEKQQIKGVRIATRRLQMIGEQEREQMSDHVKGLISIFEAEIQQMKTDHGHKVNHLYKKIDKLVVEKDQDIQQWNAVHRGYEAEMEKSQIHIKHLVEVVNKLTTARAQELMDFMCAYLHREQPPEEIYREYEAELKETLTRDPNLQKQKEAKSEKAQNNDEEIGPQTTPQQTRTETAKLVAEKDQAILDWQNVCQEHEAELRQLRGYNKELEQKLGKVEGELKDWVGPNTQGAGTAAKNTAQTTMNGQAILNDTQTQAHGLQQAMDHDTELQQLRVQNAEQRQIISSLQWSLARIGRQLPFSSHQPWVRYAPEPTTPPPSIHSHSSPELQQPFLADYVSQQDRLGRTPRTVVASLIPKPVVSLPKPRGATGISTADRMEDHPGHR